MVEEAKRRKLDFYESSDHRSDSSGEEDLETVAASEGMYRYFFDWVGNRSEFWLDCRIPGPLNVLLGKL